MFGNISTGLLIHGAQCAGRNRCAAVNRHMQGLLLPVNRAAQLVVTSLDADDLKPEIDQYFDDLIARQPTQSGHNRSVHGDIDARFRHNVVNRSVSSPSNASSINSSKFAADHRGFALPSPRRDMSQTRHNTVVRHRLPQSILKFYGDVQWCHPVSCGSLSFTAYRQSAGLRVQVSRSLRLKFTLDAADRVLERGSFKILTRGASDGHSEVPLADRPLQRQYEPLMTVHTLGIVLIRESNRFLHRSPHLDLNESQAALRPSRFRCHSPCSGCSHHGDDCLS